MPNCILKQWLNSYSLCVSCKFHSLLSFIFKGFFFSIRCLPVCSGDGGVLVSLLVGDMRLSTSGCRFQQNLSQIHQWVFLLICWNMVTGSLLGTIQPKSPVYCKEDQDATCGLEQWYFTTWEHFITWKHCHPPQVGGF